MLNIPLLALSVSSLNDTSCLSASFGPKNYHDRVMIVGAWSAHMRLTVEQAPALYAWRDNEKMVSTTFTLSISIMSTTIQCLMIDLPGSCSSSRIDPRSGIDHTLGHLAFRLQRGSKQCSPSAIAMFVSHTHMSWSRYSVPLLLYLHEWYLGDFVLCLTRR